VLLLVRPAAGGMREEFLLLARSLAATDLEISGCGMADPYLVHGFREAELPYFPLRLESWLSGVRNLQSLLRQQKPQLLHSHGLYAAAMASVALLFHPQVRHVVTIHTLLTPERFRGASGAVLRALAYRALSRADALVTVSNAARDSIAAVFPALRDKVRVIPNAVEIEPLLEPVNRPAMLRLLGLREDCPHVGVVARLSPEKGVDCFLRAAQILHAMGIAAEYVVVGDGPLRRHLVTLAHQLGISGEVHFLGEQIEIAPILATLDVLVIPSLSESFSLIGVKAALLGLPIVAARVGGLPEVLPESMARFVPPGDADALAEAIQEVLEDLAKRPSVWLEDLDLAMSSLAFSLRTGLNLDVEMAPHYLTAGDHQDTRVTLAERYSPQLMASRYRALYLQVLGRADAENATK